LQVQNSESESESVFCSHRCLRGLKLVSVPGKTGWGVVFGFM